MPLPSGSRSRSFAQATGEVAYATVGFCKVGSVADQAPVKHIFLLSIMVGIAWRAANATSCARRVSSKY